MRRFVVALLWSAVAAAAQPQPLGWTSGTIASGAANVLAPPAPQDLSVPAALARQIEGPTVVFYFSPTCPHCRHVAREVEALHRRVVASGAGRVLGIASASSSDEALASFRADYGISFEILHDADREILSALGIRSTPSAALLAPTPRKGKGPRVEVRGLWLPYRAGFDTVVEARIASDPFAVMGPDRYVGNALCGSCHVEELGSWMLTHHAVAWRTLEVGGHEADAACTDCHVTGAGRPGGWAGDGDSVLTDVGCEACHGPSGPHDGVPTEAASTCEGCHDAKHSIAFSVAKGLPLLDHYRINALSPAEIEARRRALYQGEAPRELLAFPEGKNVGSAACQECHAEQHAWWADTGHARAMDRLRPEGSGDPACVRCHATAKQSGPPPETLSGYRIFDGVGCESCHGPGEAHVAAEGGTDNIEGLGEDCPVCVIEAVCTGCHTTARDPDWDLQRALDETAH